MSTNIIEISQLVDYNIELEECYVVININGVDSDIELNYREFESWLQDNSHLDNDNREYKIFNDFENRYDFPKYVSIEHFRNNEQEKKIKELLISYVNHIKNVHIVEIEKCSKLIKSMISKRNNVNLDAITISELKLFLLDLHRSSFKLGFEDAMNEIKNYKKENY